MKNKVGMRESVYEERFQMLSQNHHSGFERGVLKFRTVVLRIREKKNPTVMSDGVCWRTPKLIPSSSTSRNFLRESLSEERSLLERAFLQRVWLFVVVLPRV